jgi:hypothetical protein
MRALTIVLALALVAIASVASADFIQWSGVGYGDFMDSPPTFTGGMVPPGHIEDGEWTIVIPDAGWPLDPVARQSYIWNTFYAPNYEPGTPGFWKGYFDAFTNNEHNSLYIVDDTNGGTMNGTVTLEIQVQDSNSNGVLDEGEFCDGSHTGIVIIIQDGTGVYDGWCGNGNFYGSYVVDCPNTYETWNFGMYLWIDDCSTPVESATWGSIKALYQ